MTHKAFYVLTAFLHEQEVRKERGGGDPHERTNLLEVARHGSNDHVAMKPRPMPLEIE